MSETNTQQSFTEVTQGAEPAATDLSPQWGVAAPRGGKTVVNRALKDGATVPLFLGQTLIKSLRDLGYNNTTSALCEHVDNALQWGATEVRVYFRQTGKQPNQRIDSPPKPVSAEPPRSFAISASRSSSARSISLALRTRIAVCLLAD